MRGDEEPEVRGGDFDGERGELMLGTPAGGARGGDGGGVFGEAGDEGVEPTAAGGDGVLAYEGFAEVGAVVADEVGLERFVPLEDEGAEADDSPRVIP